MSLDRIPLPILLKMGQIHRGIRPKQPLSPKQSCSMRNDSTKADFSHPVANSNQKPSWNSLPNDRRNQTISSCIPQTAFLLLFLFAVNQSTVEAFQHEHTPSPDPPKIATASDEGVKAIKSFKFPTGWKMEQAAAEPDVANIVAFHVDNNGRIFVCETYRQERGVDDMRNHPDWLPDELAARTVADRLKYMKKHLKGDLSKYTKYDDRIRLITDQNKNGKFDRSVVYADGFNRAEQGTGAGVLHYKGKTYYTCIPDLVILEDHNNDGKAEVRKIPHTGYGVRIAFRGHDSHGLVVGPMGRLYYSIGDRGYNIQTKNGSLVDPESGAVFRCELDGSNLEVIATGLRNPQELTFDKYGNLFTGDNNSDSGDKARWVYIAEGGDTGWRMYYQYLPDRGPFNREKIWHPFHSDTPASIVPPITNFGDGPSGVAYYPGTGFGPEMEDRFFMCDFRGQSSNSGIRSFRLDSKGAFFELVDSEKPIWKILATDLQFGPDGHLYVSDWVHGWSGVNKGRIYRLSDPNAPNADEIKEVKELLGGEIANAKNKRLKLLLGHKDLRVRQEAQFELVRRHQFQILADVARSGLEESELAQLHGQWGLMQLHRQHKLIANSHSKKSLTGKELKTIAAVINNNLSSDFPPVKAWAAELSAELSELPSNEKLGKILRTESGQAAYKACLTVGKRKMTSLASDVMNLLSRNGDSDPIIRHGGIMALAGIDDPSVWKTAISHPSVSVRIAAAVALGKKKNPLVARMLQDSDPKVVLEAARAIHDKPIPLAMPSLAKHLSNCGSDDALVRRCLNANFRLGGKEQASRLCLFVTQANRSADRRLQALDHLSNWGNPSPIDAVIGQHRLIGKRTNQDAANAVRQNLALVMGTDNPKVNAKAGETAAKLGITEVAANLQKVISESKNQALRAGALVSLYRLKKKEVSDLVIKSCSDPSPLFRSAALRILSQSDPAKASPFLERAIRSGTTEERKSAVDSVAAIDPKNSSKSINQVLKLAADQYASWDQKKAVKLELTEALAQHKIPSSLRLLPYRNPKHPIAGKYDELTDGGNAENGRRIFFQKTDVSCVRCHKIDGTGGEVGPDLSDVADKRTVTQLLEALLLPNQAIAEGFQSEIILDIDGKVHTGIVKQETDEFVRLIDADGKIIQVLQDDIEERKTGLSSMPSDIRDKLSRREIRDLVEFLKLRKSSK